MTSRRRNFLTAPCCRRLRRRARRGPASDRGQGRPRCAGSSGRRREVGEKLMNELKAAFEKEHPDGTLTMVDNPFPGFHDKAITLFQAEKLANVLMVQVDWVAELADLGMLEPLEPGRASEPKDYMDDIFPTFHKKWRGAVLPAGPRRPAWRSFGTPRSSRRPGSPAPQDLGRVRGRSAKKVTQPGGQKIFATTAMLCRSSRPPT